MAGNHKGSNHEIVNDTYRKEYRRCDKEKFRNKNKGLFSIGNTSDISAMFTSADALLPIDEEAKRRTLEKLRAEIKAKDVLPLSSKPAIWLCRMRYTDRSMLVFHVLGCIVMSVLMVMMNEMHIDYDTMIAFSMILAGMLGSLSVLQVGKVCFARLSELSETCFFNVRQMAAFDMAFSGIINLTVLSFVILFAGLHWKIHLIRIGLYILVPFVFTQCVCLGILLTETGRRNGWITVSAGIFLSAFYALLASTPQLYTRSALFVWGIALAIGGVILGLQIKTLFTEINKGEILCTNWN